MFTFAQVKSTSLELHWGAYSHRGRIPNSRWMGEGAKRLGLSGGVRRIDILAAFEGYTPGRGASLLALEGDRGVPKGWMFQRRAPASLCALWAAAPSKVQIDLESCHREGFASGVERLEQHLQTMASSGGAADSAWGAAVALFQSDPYEHDVPTIVSTGFLADVAIPDKGPSQRWAITSTGQHSIVKLLNESYQKVLGEQLYAKLGLELHQSAEGEPQIIGVPRTLRFSGDRYGSPWSVLERLFATEESRKSANWRNQSSAQNWRPGHVSSLLDYSKERRDASHLAEKQSMEATSAGRDREQKEDSAAEDRADALLRFEEFRRRRQQEM